MPRLLAKRLDRATEGCVVHPGRCGSVRQALSRVTGQEATSGRQGSLRRTPMSGPTEALFVRTASAAQRAPLEARSSPTWTLSRDIQTHDGSGGSDAAKSRRRWKESPRRTCEPSSSRFGVVQLVSPLPHYPSPVRLLCESRHRVLVTDASTSGPTRGLSTVP